MESQIIEDLKKEKVLLRKWVLKFKYFTFYS